MSDMPAEMRPAKGYRFGVFEVNVVTGELRRRGLRVRLHAQPFAVLLMLLDRPGEMVSREEICRALWPEGTFVDYEHGLNSAVNRLREALGDKAVNPKFVETLARRGYRFLASVEKVGDAAPVPEPAPGILDSILAGPDDLPRTSHRVVKTLFVLLQAMYIGFYVGALANLAEIEGLMEPLPGWMFALLVVSATLLIPVRIFLLCAVAFRAPGLSGKYRRLWWVLLPMDCVWALAPFLLLHHIPYGLALACVTPLVYSPFAQRSLMLMGAGD
jgi:DNA-binding winged helix-turn-helix (wHTH) protein